MKDYIGGYNVRNMYILRVRVYIYISYYHKLGLNPNALRYGSVDSIDSISSLIG
jgi:hypothetical protein